VLERAQILAEGDTITTDDLPENLIQVSKPSLVPGAPAVPAAGPDDLDGVERRHVEDVLRRNSGNKVQAARALGVSRRSLYRLIDRYRLADVNPSTGA
jgi:transcriptional regulator of acetoin/glycerol metabolism